MGSLSSFGQSMSSVAHNLTGNFGKFKCVWTYCYMRRSTFVFQASKISIQWTLSSAKLDQSSTRFKDPRAARDCGGTVSGGLEGSRAAV